MKTCSAALIVLLMCVVLALADDNVVTVTAERPIPTSEPSYTDGDDFKDAMLETTNQYREEHSASPLEWNNTLASFAKEHAEKCEFEHSGGPYGENLAIGYPNASASVEAWGDERDDYSYSKGKFTKKTGHFTQLVWNSTEEVGCGRKYCGDDEDGPDAGRGWIVVCEYWPRGNVEGEFKEEVGRQEDGSGRIGVDWRAAVILLASSLWVLDLI